MRFDWYQASFEQSPEVLISTLSKLGTDMRPCDGKARKWHYQSGFEVLSDRGETLATVMFGGNGGKPHALATSDATDRFVDLVRNEWPDHLVTRFDACQDFHDGSAYPRLCRILKATAKEHGLAFPAFSDTLNPDAGRTQYVGSPKSDNRVRLYEKGLEVAGKLKATQFFGLANLTFHDENTGQSVKPHDWIRLELQSRPREERAKRLAAQLSAEEAWSVSDWTHQLAVKALRLDIERIFMRTVKLNKDDATMQWMTRQYEAVLLRMASDLGGWPAVGEHIGALIESRKTHRQ